MAATQLGQPHHDGALDRRGAPRASRGYRAVFRRSLETQQVQPQELRLSEPDLFTIETLVEELGHPDARHVLHAIDLLESFDKRRLISPLLLHHASPEVRARALRTVEAADHDLQARWSVGVEQMLKDDHPEVRAAAAGALAASRGEQVVGLMRPYLEDRDPRMVVTAAVALAASPREEDVAAADQALRALALDTRQTGDPGAAARWRRRSGTSRRRGSATCWCR